MANKAFWFYPPTEADDLEAIPLGPVPKSPYEWLISPMSEFVSRHAYHPFMIGLGRASDVGASVWHRSDPDGTVYFNFAAPDPVEPIIYQNHIFYHSDLVFPSPRSGHCAGMPQVYPVGLVIAGVVLLDDTRSARKWMIKKPP